MAKRTARFWLNGILVAAAIVLPFGTLILIGAAIMRTRTARARKANSAYEEWWQLRAATRGPLCARHADGVRTTVTTGV
jgi:hypothetical protein